MRSLACLLLALATFAATGCAKSFTAPTPEPRTQYEIYDRVRNRYVPLTETDVFGREQPALRERLQRRG